MITQRFGVHLHFRTYYSIIFHILRSIEEILPFCIFSYCFTAKLYFLWQWRCDGNRPSCRESFRKWPSISTITPMAIISYAPACSNIETHVFSNDGNTAPSAQVRLTRRLLIDCASQTLSNVLSGKPSTYPHCCCI